MFSNTDELLACFGRTEVKIDDGAVFDSEMSMVSHVKYICRIGYYHLRNIASIRSCLTQKAAV